MPDNLTQYTYCAEPGVARSHKTMGGLLGFLINSYFKNGFITVSTTVLVLLTPFLFIPCFGVWPAVITIITLLKDFLDWYYHERLLCIKENSCVVGTVVRNLEPHGDGDRKLDLLLAPFTENECYQKMCIHINENNSLLSQPALFEDLPFHDGVPIQPINCDPDILTDVDKTPSDRRAERKNIADYLLRLKSKDPEDKDATSNVFNNLMVGFMARLLDPSNLNENGESKNFQGHFYRKDATQITQGSALWDAIPPDFDPSTNWLNPNEAFTNSIIYQNPYETAYQPRGVNQLFRLDRKKLMPFLHCEIDGKRLKLLINQLMLSLMAFATSYTMACMLLSFLGPLGFILSAGIAAIIALLIGLVQHVQDGGSEGGVAEEPDIEYDNTDNFGDENYQMDGDLVALYGNWIMDTEHTQKFEIHPVKAYYLMGRNANSQAFETFDGNDEFDEGSYHKLTNDMIDRAARDEICRLINAAEEEEPPVVIEFAPSQLLSHGLNSFYAGGRLMTT